MQTVFLLLVWLCSVQASTYYISPYGSDSNGSGNYSSPFQTLSKGVSVCANGDSLVAKPGSYPSTSVDINAAISISAEDALGTVFFSQPTLAIGSVEQVNFTNIVFFGSSGIAVGVAWYYYPSITFTNCRFSSNSVGVSNWWGTQRTIINCTFDLNDQDIGGGTAPVTITNSTFNSSGGISGGAITIIYSALIGGTGISSTGSLNIYDTLFSELSNTDGGGAINATGGSISIKGATFENCSTSSNGGAILISNKAVLDITSTLFYRNSAQSGGGVYVQQGSIFSVFESEFVDNSANEGGAYACDGTGIVDVYSCTFSNSTQSNCLQ